MCLEWTFFAYDLIVIIGYSFRESDPREEVATGVLGAGGSGTLPARHKREQFTTYQPTIGSQTQSIDLQTAVAAGAPIKVSLTFYFLFGVISPQSILNGERTLSPL